MNKITTFQVISIVIIAVSVLSLTSYGCGFKMDGSSIIYMLWFIYFRSARCSRDLNWQNFDGINNPIHIQPTMSPEAVAVMRTMYFSVIYFIAGISLLLCCVLALGKCILIRLLEKLIEKLLKILSAGMRKTQRSRCCVFTCYFLPFIILLIIISVFDLFASGFYIFEHFYSYSVDGLMSILEIANIDQIRPILERIAFSTRVLPSLIIFATTSKSVFLLVFNFFIIFNFPSAAWKLCSENEDYLLNENDEVTQDVNTNESQQENPGHFVRHESHF